MHLFNSAIELDPDFASAYGRAACCYAFAKGFGWILGTAGEIAEVKRLVKRAVELGKDDAVALANSGWALVHVVGDLELGAALIDRALLLNSNLADAWLAGGWIRSWSGEPELAIECFAHAMRLNPLDPRMAGMRTGTAYAYFLLSRYDEAASWAAMALQDIPDFHLDCVSPPRATQWPNGQNWHTRQWLGCVNSLPTYVFPVSKTWCLIGGPKTSHDTKKR